MSMCEYLFAVEYQMDTSLFYSFFEFVQYVLWIKWIKCILLFVCASVKNLLEPSYWNT